MTRLRARLAGSEGFGLVELIVSMTLGSVLLLALGATFDGTLRTTRAATTRVANTAELRSAADVMARRLRVAVRPGNDKSVAVDIATPTHLRFYASLTTVGNDADQAPTRVEYTVLPDCLQEIRTTPTGTDFNNWNWDVPASTRTTCLTRSAVNADGSALFTYYPLATSPVVAVSDTPLAATVTGTDLATIRSVGVSVSVRKNATDSVRGSSAQTRVTLVNLTAS